MLDLINRHKLERDQFLSKTYVEREGVSEAQKHLKFNLIKVIIGPRRAGKSFFGFLMLKNKNFAYLNFDDEELLKINDYDKLVENLRIVYGDYDYIFFDEIQNLPKWELLVNKMQRRGSNLILTGSNSKLLSGELASSLTGRYVQIEVLPLSFSEVIKHDSKMNFNKYLISGGYPEVVIKKLDQNEYLKTLFEAVLFKDVVKRFSLRHPKKIYELGIYLMSNFSSIYSYHKLKKAVNLSSVATTQKYVDLLEQTLMFFSLNKFDFKVKNQFSYGKKVYAVDNGLVSSGGFQNSENLGRLLENTIFIDLVRKGFVPNKDLFYYKTKSGKEVDFILRKGLEVIELVQVCLNLDSEKTLRREKAALIEASKELNCKKLIIVVLDQTGFEDGVKIIKAEDYLLKYYSALKERVA